MRTKALLLAAAFAAAGVATSVAQVYSVNAVGYVNVTAPSGFSLIANPLNAGAGNNTVANLFDKTKVTPSLPLNSKVYVYDTTTGLFKTITFSPLSQTWNPASDAASVIDPGNGVFFQNPSASAITITFVGEVPQGPLSNPIPTGFSIKANQVPQAVKPDSVGYPGAPNDKIFQYVPATGIYNTYTFSPLSQAWNPVLPAFPVGEAWYAFRAPANGATSWNRTFSVNG
jgi:hypothetical protein